MRRDLVKPFFKSSFQSCEKDAELILRKIFIESKDKDDTLKRLLLINAKDCLDNLNNEVYLKKLKETSLGKMVDEGYIRLEPKIRFPENAEIKSYIIMEFDNFTPNETNPEFRDYTVNFDIICHTDYWNIGNYRLRPLKIAGYIDGALDRAKLTGIGRFEFMGMNEMVLDENLSGYTLSYRAIHGSDDKISAEEWTS